MKKVNVVMGGGGVKGVAYIGVFDSLERRGYVPVNLAGVSAGSLAGALSAAGYNAAGMWRVMDQLDFDKIQVDKALERLPVVRRFVEYMGSRGTKEKAGVEDFLVSSLRPEGSGNNDMRKLNILKSVVTYCKEGCLFDGDLLEEWVSKALAKRGIRTFADLRTGNADALNPRGYKVRMTGVDCNRMKVVTLPDDLVFYGIDPDRFEVAKAVRISTAVPFAFKPVEVTGVADGRNQVYSLVDGGVLDSFPGWLMDDGSTPGLGFKLNAGESKIFSLDMPLSIFKSLITSVHDIGTPETAFADKYSAALPICEIDTRKVGFLDFGLTAENKNYLVNAGRHSALRLLDSVGNKQRGTEVNYLPYGFRIYPQKQKFNRHNYFM